ncbi:MAG TPA: hypothetical protein VK524_31050, partial [Polyangiaceae bacterium]|nr:hypothetical protein [Polyangiaceae bacterium]
APQQDFVVRTLAKREAGTLLLMTGEIVIAGADTRGDHPLANVYPLHFRKTYFPGRLHGDPKHEYDSHMRASELIGLPQPVGHGPRTFRSCLIPGTPYNRLSPFGAEPEESNIGAAHKLALTSAAGLWRMLEEAFQHLTRLHAGGLTHGDPELHNFIVSPSPLELVLIDFEAAATKADLGERFMARCAQDLLPLLRESVFVQCALGRQSGALAELCWQRMDELFKAPDRFRDAIANEAHSA